MQVQVQELVLAPELGHHRQALGPVKEPAMAPGQELALGLVQELELAPGSELAQEPELAPGPVQARGRSAARRTAGSSNHHR